MMADSEIESIESEMKDASNDSDYWHDEQKQERYRQLVDADGKSSVPVESDRKRELEKLMEDGSSEYWRGDKAQALQDEYLRLLDGITLGQPMIAPEWGLSEAESETSSRTLGNIESALGVVADEIGDAAAVLSDGVRGAILREFGQEATTPVSVTEEEVREFFDTDHGRILASEWGRDSAKVGAIFSRWDRLTGGLNEADFAELDDFVGKRLSADEVAKIMRELV